MGNRTKVSDFCKQVNLDPAWCGQFLAKHGVDVDRAGTVSTDDFFALWELLSEGPAKVSAAKQVPKQKPKSVAKLKKSRVKLRPLEPSLSTKEIQETRGQLNLPLPSTTKKSGCDKLAVHRERLRIPALFAKFGLKAIHRDGEPSPSRFMVTGNRVYAVVRTRGKSSPSLSVYVSTDDFDWLLYMHMGTEYIYSAAEIAAWKGHCFPTEPKFELSRRVHLLRNPPLHEVVPDPEVDTEETSCVAQMLTP